LKDRGSKREVCRIAFDAVPKGALPACSHVPLKSYGADWWRAVL